MKKLSDAVGDDPVIAPAAEASTLAILYGIAVAVGVWIILLIYRAVLGVGVL